ncbi:MAG: hypothetical protein IPM53_33580 [Anaerolineaceae bacterium]|nr:hypothetical protein [Anaerolineaceae bacterium]
MKRSKKVIQLLTLVMLLLSVGTVAAYNEGHLSRGSQVRVRLTNATIPWEVPSLIGGPDESQYQCSLIPEGLEIAPVDNASNRTKIATVRNLPGGGRVIVVHDTVSGLAADQYGGTYTFLYKTKTTFRYDGEGVVQVRMVDDFWITGGDVDYNVSFIWQWMYEAPQGIEVETVYDGSTAVNLEVSPGPFPTDDGFTESPNIIPGSWIQIETNGFIFGCDPI